MASYGTNDFKAPLLINKEDDVHDHEVPKPQDTTTGDHSYTSFGIWSKITFQWMGPVFRRGCHIRKLELSHIPSLPPSQTAQSASTLLQESLDQYSSLRKAIWRTIWMPLFINAVFAGISAIASFTGPFLITYLVNYILGKYDGSSNINYGVILALVFFSSKTLESLTERQWKFGGRQIGLRVRAALTALLYKKSISIKYSGPSSGEISTLIIDVETIGELFSDIQDVWLTPLKVFLAVIILYINLGAAPCVTAFVTTVLVLLCNTPVTKLQKTLHLKISEARDSRMKTTAETLKSIKVVKFNSWESRFSEKLLQLRETEESWIKRFLNMKSLGVLLFWTSPTIVSVTTFGVCILVKTPLEPSTVLSALTTIAILGDPLFTLSDLISYIAKAGVAVDRIQAIMMRSEDQIEVIPACHTTSRVWDDTMIVIETGEYAWNTSNDDDQSLQSRPAINITEKINIRKGEKVAVCGSVGSGKSSLLCSILGEIPQISGAAGGAKVYGTKAYVPQSAWIQTGTIRENVLFGKEVDWGHYEDVLEACALNPDIKLWPNGDLTSVGERGMNVSGGQKQRIQLARAVYSDSDVYILDDPFSAVDAHTGSHLFQKCLLQHLSAKTIIYATHQLEFLEAADLVLVVKDGQIVQSGAYRELIEDPNGELVRQTAAHRKSLHQVHTSPQQDSSGPSESKLEVETSSSSSSSSTSSESGSSNSTSSESGTSETEEIVEVEAGSGRVEWSVYSTFVTYAYGGLLVPVILLCHILFQGLQMASNYWIAYAAEKENRVTREKLMWMFTLLSGGSSLFVVGRAVFMSVITNKTSHRLFVGMITSVFRAPMAFFDSTPSSRIISRSSTDQSTVDTDIPYRLAGLVFALIQVICVVILMSLVAWQVIPLFLAVLGLSFWYQAYYITTARELARMVAKQKSPVLHHFQESIAGAATIRCFNQEDRFLRKIKSVIDDFSGVAFCNYATMEWLSLRINFFFNVAFFAVLIALVSLPRSAVDPNLAGLAASYGLKLSVLQGWVIWNLCNVEDKMISVQRILQFTRIESEAPLVIEGCRPKPEWPTEGLIELQNLQVQYRPSLPMVLKGITCTFPGMKKIGVVGRTGSGKSTLIQALFRVVEPSRGQILIDGMDITRIGLQDLRSRLAIIPQDPTLFHGTMRTNLDPLQQHSDLEIWEVVNKCRLGDIVRQDQRLLDAPVAEDGENWSVGQRQLVCLARVLLKKRRILVLDEATSSIDTATEMLIQETIREETSDCTVITVAHRITTVIDNDLVLVLDQGEIIEYDSPARLMKDSSSALSKLVAEFLRRSSRSMRKC